MKVSLHQQFDKNLGFTLIEMLAAIAILALMVGLLFPVAGNLLNNARTTRTISNLKSLHQANTAYAADNNGQFVPLMTGTWSGGWKWNDRFLQILGSGNPGSDSYNKVMHSGFWSPKFPNATIAYNGYKTPGSPAPWSEPKIPLRATDPQRAATLIAFIEADDWWVDPYRYDRWISREVSDVEGRSPGASPAYRNANRRAAAITFAGNVVMFSQEELDWRTPEGKARWFYDGAQ